MLVAGSLRSGFPSERERLLLGTAANGVTFALNCWQTETQEQRLVTIIERSSDFIGFATMDGTPQYINPVGHKLVGLAVGEAISHLRIFDVLAAHDRRRALCCPSCLTPVVGLATRFLSFQDWRNHSILGRLVPYRRYAYWPANEPHDREP
jgi:two-component system, LuxR family, sensor kinase FixL